MNPHELFQHTYQTAQTSDGFTERVLSAAELQTKAKPQRRLVPALLAAAVIVSCLTVGVFASPTIRHWLFGVVSVGQPVQTQIETQTGRLDLTVDYGDIQERFGEFFCVGRFLYTEVEFTSSEKSQITDDDILELWNRHSDQLELTYDEKYTEGPYLVEGEGWVRSQIRLDDGMQPGYARYTFLWTLKRHDYDGTLLRVQLWEPKEWGPERNGVREARNDTTRRMLEEKLIERKTPEDERTCYLADGSEVRLCSFGAEVQGREFAQWDMHAKKPDAYGTGAIDSGVVLADGSKLPFLYGGSRGYSAEIPDEQTWSAVPFSAALDPAQVVALYRADETFPLTDEKP